MKTGRVYIKDKEIDVLLAISQEEQEKGLMGQKWPPPAMAFVYSYPKYNKFWMKATPSPLDIVFCKNGKIHSIFEGKPFSLSQIGPDDFTDLVLEFPKGFCKDNSINNNDDVFLVYDLSK